MLLSRYLEIPILGILLFANVSRCRWIVSESESVYRSSRDLSVKRHEFPRALIILVCFQRADISDQRYPPRYVNGRRASEPRMSRKDCRRTYNWISQPTRSCVASLPQQPVKDSRCTIIANAYTKQVNSVHDTAAWNELAKIARPLSSSRWQILFYVNDFAVATSRRRCLIHYRK